ncbi:MAG: GTP-binding protein [Candidatus Lokiarchaeota archaeon]
MENLLNTLLSNYLNSVDELLAVAACDKNGLILASVGSEELGESSDAVIGVVSAMLDEYFERIKKEFGTEDTFFNVTTTKERKFAFCSMGSNAILTTIAKPSASDMEIKVFSEHVAQKIGLILKRKNNITLEIPEIVKALSKTKSGKISEGEYSAKIILTGDPKVGKTSLVRRFVENKFTENYLTTIGVDITKKEVELIQGKTTVSFLIWDIGGQFSRYRQKFYNGANAALMVIDRTRLETLKSVNDWYDDIKNSIKRDIPVVLVGNKSDLVSEIKVSEEDIKKVAKELDFHYIITSAKTGENVSDLFMYVGYVVVETM